MVPLQTAFLSNYSTPKSSTSKSKVAFGGIVGKVKENNTIQNQNLVLLPESQLVKKFQMTKISQQNDLNQSITLDLI